MAGVTDAELQAARQVNERLRSALLRFCPENLHCSNLTPDDFLALSAQLAEARNLLSQSSSKSESGSAMEQAERECRDSLRKLKQSLPDLLVRLLTERSRLEAARVRLAAAEEWARARNKSL